jgi:hypothetical protein
MTTFANVLALLGMSMIRFGGRISGGFIFMLFGLIVVGVVVWALTRPTEYVVTRSNGPSGRASSPASTQE